MATTYNVYCDESGHLQNDGLDVMVLGAVWCPLQETRRIAFQLRNIKKKYGLPSDFETKWVKVSKGKADFYLEFIEYFFEESALHFRALVVPDKSLLCHESYAQDHDTWYYKMYFDMLKVILAPHDRYRIYLDIKDTCSAEKVARLHQVLCNNIYDFRKEIIERVQTVHSHEVEQIQLADLLIGAVSYANRGLSNNAAKVRLVEEMRKRSGYSLEKTTLYRETKVNLLRWRATESD